MSDQTTTEQLYRVMWKLKGGGPIIQGRGLVTLVQARAWVQYWNERQPEFEHWYEPVNGACPHGHDDWDKCPDCCH